MSDKAGAPPRRPRPVKVPRPGLQPPPGEPKLKSKQARIERQRARAENLNNAPDWFGVPRGNPGKSKGDSFESITSLTEKTQVGAPAATFTGFRELQVKSALVILGLWALRFFIPWVEAWHEFTLHLLIDPSHWARFETYFAYHVILIFVGKSVACVTISVIVDLLNSRLIAYLMILFILLLYICTPIAGVASLVILIARNYDRPYYFAWWHRMVVMMGWARAIPFIAFPLLFFCIFYQEENMSRLAHYNWTAVFVFIEVLNVSLAHWFIPPNCPTGYFTLFAVWCAIAVLTLFLWIEVLSLMRWARLKKSQPVESTSKTDSKPGDRSKPNPKEEPNREVDRPRGQKMKWFLITLVPVVFTSAVFEILKRTRPEEDWDKHDSIDATSMLSYGQCLGVLLMVSVMTVLRRWTNLHKWRRFTPDVLVLGIPLIINAIALAAIFGRFMVHSGLAEGDVILGPIPTEQVSVIEFYNVEFRNRTICVQSEDFGPLKVPPRRRATSVLRDPGARLITFTVTLDPRTNPPIRTYGNFTYKKGAWISYVVTLPSSQLNGSDIDAIYSELQLLRINETDDILPKREPTIVFINTYVVNVDGWYYNVTANGKTDVVEQTRYGIAMLQSYPPGELSITYWTEFTDLVQSGAHSPITTQLSVENYSVYTVLLCLSNIMKDPSNLSELVPRMLQTHKTMEIAGPECSRLPAKEELDTDWAIILGTTLAGMAKSGIYIGWLYLFWLDFPFTGYRTTIMAGFWILISVPVELATLKVVDIDINAVTALFGLQILFTLWHFGTASILYLPKFNFRARPD